MTPNDSKLPQLQPFDKHNAELESHVHPVDWKNPEADKPYHLVVIGAGTAGLVTAAGAAGLGARVALIERELMGGDCLNVGCVPSKALIGPANIASIINRPGMPGIETAGPAVGSARVDFSRIMERMREKRASIGPHDSAQRFKDLGVDVYFGQGAFVDGQTISVTDRDERESKLEFRKAVIATGARASAPPIKGLDSVEYLTNETLFSLTELPKRFGIVGGGPIGCEMAQAFSRLGSEVFLFERSEQILAREDSDAAEIVQRQLAVDGVQLILDCGDLDLSPADNSEIKVGWKAAGQEQQTVVDQLLIAVGRAPNIEKLNLDAAGVRSGKKGIEVNDFLQTSNKNVFAAGDVCSKYKFTHTADFQARIVIQNALFALGSFGRKKSSQLVVPWATYTSPEIAHVGMYEKEAEKAGIRIDTYIQEFSGNDRAIVEGNEAGFVKVHTRKGTDKIVGATIVGPHAGDLISEITVAMNNGIGLSGIGSSIHPYPTRADAIRRLGDQYNRTRLTPIGKKVLNLLRRINVGS